MKKKLLAVLFTALMVVGSGTAALAADKSDVKAKAVKNPPVTQMDDPPGF